MNPKCGFDESNPYMNKAPTIRFDEFGSRIKQSLLKGGLDESSPYR